MTVFFRGDWEGARIRLLSGRGSVHAGAYTDDGWALRYCDARTARPGTWEKTEDPLSCRKCLKADGKRALAGLDPLDTDSQEGVKSISDDDT